MAKAVASDSASSRAPASSSLEPVSTASEHQRMQPSSSPTASAASAARHCSSILRFWDHLSGPEAALRPLSTKGPQPSARHASTRSPQAETHILAIERRSKWAAPSRRRARREAARAYSSPGSAPCAARSDAMEECAFT